MKSLIDATTEGDQLLAALDQRRRLPPARGERLGGSVADRDQPGRHGGQLVDVRAQMAAVETILKAVE